MIPKFHENDDLFAITFRPKLVDSPHIVIEVPPDIIFKEGQMIRVIAPSRNLDDRFTVTNVQRLSRETKFDPIVDRVEAQFMAEAGEVK